jgi:hypothetical protein
MRFVMIFSVLAMILAACGSGDSGDPAAVVESYLEAKAAADREGVAAKLCAEMESSLNREATSFSSVEARVEEMSCSRDGDADTVTCSGAIVADYGGEDTSFPLATYRVVEEDGVWKWCGEAAAGS